MSETTVQEFIDILNRVENKNLPLIMRTKFIKPEHIKSESIDAAKPNDSVEIYSDYCVLNLLPIDNP